jgi:hypothetical protein
MKPTEADMFAGHAMFVGLISMLTGSTDPQELKIISDRIYERGRNILGNPMENNENTSAREFQTAAFPPLSRRR